MLAAGTQLGRYEIAAPLGAGGMGEVYRAMDSRLDRQVAIKVLPPQFVQDQARLARFEREAKVVAALSHPNILGIHDFGTEQGQTFAVMELLEGETLRRRIDDVPIPWRKAVEIALAIADGLTAAHAKGIIHRDLKPENIFLTTSGWVKILDFGLARIELPLSPSGDTPTESYHPAQTEVGTILGTVGYMSPEQVRGEQADSKSDVFSLGCVLYEMVSGKRAFGRPSSVEAMAAILHDEPPELVNSGTKAPLELDRLIRRCLEKNPAARFAAGADQHVATVTSRQAAGVGQTFVPVGVFLALDPAGCPNFRSVGIEPVFIVAHADDGTELLAAGGAVRLHHDQTLLKIARFDEHPIQTGLGRIEEFCFDLDVVGDRDIFVVALIANQDFLFEELFLVLLGQPLGQAVDAGRIVADDLDFLLGTGALGFLENRAGEMPGRQSRSVIEHTLGSLAGGGQLDGVADRVEAVEMIDDRADLGEAFAVGEYEMEGD